MTKDTENYLLRKQDLRKFFSEFYEWLNKPIISPLMLIFLILVIVVDVVINSILFTQLALYSLIISIFLYLPVALVKAKQKSGLMTLVSKILEILIKEDETDEQKVIEMENAVKYLMDEINKYYEKQLERFTNYLRKKRGVIQNE